ncbi:hypothetical protein ACS0TY_000121 [Phlomoides rotata]
MRVADVSVNNNTCTFPYYFSLLHFFFRPYRLMSYSSISLMMCPYPLKNSPLFTQLPTHCDQPSNSSTHTYIKLGGMNVTDVGDNCTLYITATSWAFKDLEKVSVSEIHDSLLYGFQLSWNLSQCIACYGRVKCPHKEHEVVSCRHGLGEMLESLWGVKQCKSHELNLGVPFSLTKDFIPKKGFTLAMFLMGLWPLDSFVVLRH